MLVKVKKKSCSNIRKFSGIDKARDILREEKKVKTIIKKVSAIVLIMCLIMNNFNFAETIEQKTTASNETKIEESVNEKIVNWFAENTSRIKNIPSKNFFLLPYFRPVSLPAFL